MSGTNYEYLLKEYLDYNPLDNIDREELIKYPSEENGHDSEKGDRDTAEEFECPF